MSHPARSQLLSVAALVSLLVLFLGASGLFSLHYAHARELAALDRQARLDEVRSRALEAQISFKTQVQEWKNVLLRGRDAEAYARHWASFQTQEAAVQTGLAAVREQVATLHLSDVNVAGLDEAHRALGAEYRAALATWTREDAAGAFGVDATMRGRDRKFGADVDALADQVAVIAARELRVIGEDAAALYAGLRKAVLIVATLAVLAALWLVFLANRGGRA